MSGLGDTFDIGGDLTVHRLGYGAMQILGEGRWGPPADPANAVAVLRRAVELGVDLIDTADSYGPFVSEDLIREALHPYDGVAIATKAGFVRTGPHEWRELGYPPYLRQCAEMSLRRLGVDVAFPSAQTCCGQPMVNTGCLDEAVPLLRNHLDAFAGCEAIVAPSGSCAGSVRHQHRLVAERSADPGLVRAVDAAPRGGASTGMGSR